MVKGVMAGIAVTDIERSVVWYSRALRAPPAMRLAPDNAEWQFPDGSWLKLYQDPGRAGFGTVSIFSLAWRDRIAELTLLGHVSIEACRLTEDMLCELRDPDGNRLIFSMG